jgi:DNA-binding response OmpR family regulator/anti-sigma regulatory factor (Ser/Thr protein kinase)
MTTPVLIVDGSMTVRMDMKELLDAAGFASTACATIAEARALLAHLKYRLLVVDGELSDGHGSVLAREARSLSPPVPVILLTNEWQLGDHAIADDYLGKPYDRERLVARAQALTFAPTVLLIDDSRSVLEELGNALERAGYLVVSAMTGEAGLLRAAELRPSAVIVDGGLPGIDGPTVIRRLRLDPALRHTPCILLTGSDDSGAEVQALESGADSYARKSESAEIVLARLGALVRTASDRQTPLPSNLLGRKRVLAVDDSETYLHELEAGLSAAGYDVALAHSGAEALQHLARERTDCVLLDLVMPGMSGNETCRHIRALPTSRDIPVLMLTALEEREGMLEGFSAGADDYISKSSDFEVLKARLRAQLRRKEFEDEHRVVREQLLRKEFDEAEARATRELADTRAALLADLEAKNRELAEAKERAERESRFKSTFLANMSHELRTPLNAIIGFSELLSDDESDALTPVHRTYLGYVLSSGKHLLSVINDVLDLSRVAAGRMELHREPASLPLLIEEAAATLAADAQKQGLTVTLQLPDAFPTLQLDVVRMRQVLFNLLSNAVKFTRSGGSVTVTLRELPDTVEVAIADTGIGIAPEDVQRLFREFERIERDDGPAGTGLGLVLTQRLVGLHGGVVSVASQPAQGTTFTVSLPRA